MIDYTWTNDTTHMCYLKTAWKNLQVCPGAFSGGLAARTPPPPPPPPVAPLTLIFSADAPSPLGGPDAVVLGQMTLVNGTALVSSHATLQLLVCTGLL